MKKTIGIGVSTIVVAALLAACGGGNTGSSSISGNQPVVDNKSLTPQHKTVATDYNDTVQELYISYFGRPADPTGLANGEAALLADNAPTNIQAVIAAYSTNPALKALIDSVQTSPESIALYGNSSALSTTAGATAFVTAIYQNVLNRAPDPSGLNFWVTAITSGQLSQGNAALSIMAGALLNTTPQGLLDGQLVTNRLAVADNFTAQVSSLNVVSAYSGNTAAATARTMLSAVTATTDTNAYQTNVYNTINGLVVAVFAQVQAIVVQRCVPCHSSHPTEPGYTSAPLGYMYDTADEIAAYASLMYQNAVVTTFMPYGNATGMTTAERNTFGAWYLAGALQTASSTPISTPPDPDPDPDPDPGW